MTYEPLHNPRANPLKFRQALEVKDDYVPTEEDVAGVEMTMETRPELGKLAKQLADELGEQHPQAWYHYIGWANQLIAQTIQRFPVMKYRDILKQVGL